MRQGVHDTARHLQHLRDCLAEHADHRLASQIEPVAEDLLRAAEALPAVDGVPTRVMHGDPKFNNILFEGPDAPASLRAVGLIDLDTVGPLEVHLELGDAWRSWCNPQGENATEARFDLEVFEASVHGWSMACDLGLSIEEKQALEVGVDWITLELASRFLADALTESYFGWDDQRYATRGEHNLVRARGQLALHHCVVANRAERAEVLRGVFG
jgi:thiamine kinase-like enzyme